MLGRLSRQIDEVYAAEPGRGAFELLLLYDNHEVGEAAVRANVEKYFAADAPACQLRFVAAPGLNYYEQKNRGAELARGEIVVYIDSDVIPEERWLESLLTPLADPHIQIVCGNSYLAAEGPYSKAFALFWFFPLRAAKDTLQPQYSFFANNFAVCRETMLEHPFQPVSGTARAGAWRWPTGSAQGITIYCNSAARVSHPAPFGFSHFWRRALVQGRDHVLMRRSLGKGGFFRNLPKVLLLPLRASWKIVRNGRHVKLSLPELPAAIAIAIAYNLLAITGYLITHLAPSYAEQNWHV